MFLSDPLAQLAVQNLYADLNYIGVPMIWCMALCDSCSLTSLTISLYDPGLLHKLAFVVLMLLRRRRVSIIPAI